MSDALPPTPDGAAIDGAAIDGAAIDGLTAVAQTASPPRGLRAVIWRELRRVQTRRTYPLLLVILPLLGWILLRSVFGAHVVRDLPVVVIDADRSALSRRVARAIDATAAVHLIERRAGSGNAERVLLRGEAYGVVILPEGMQRVVARNERAPVQLFTNGRGCFRGG